MKKNITINLCGRLFQIDEDAYEMLQQYIESLRSSFGREEGGDEIVDDIEARIAELFDELRQQGIEAITIDHVKDIITRIGRPEELTGNDNVNDNHNDNGNNGHRYDSFRSAAQDVIDNVRARTAGKRLYRNPKDKMLTGVCSGLAAYTNTDPVIWRLLFVLLVLFYGIGIISYIVLSLIVPEAHKPEELLQMEGRDVTPQNLADAVVEKDTRPAEPRRSFLGSIFSFVLKLLAGFFLCILAIVAFVLLVCFLLALGALIIVFTVPSAVHHDLPFYIGAASACCSPSACPSMPSSTSCSRKPARSGLWASPSASSASSSGSSPCSPSSPASSPCRTCAPSTGPRATSTPGRSRLTACP